jgi:hypothetical protein
VYYTEVQTLFSHDLLFRNRRLAQINGRILPSVALGAVKVRRACGSGKGAKNPIRTRELSIAMLFGYVDAQLD